MNWIFYQKCLSKHKNLIIQKINQNEKKVNLCEARFNDW